MRTSERWRRESERMMEEPVEGIEEGQLRRLLTSTIDTIEDNKTQIFDIYQNTRSEVDDARERLTELKKRVAETIARVDSLAALTVRENILLPALLTGQEETAAVRADALMERLGIRKLASVTPSELSGGELRRVTIARALVMQPGILLADEPTGDLDEENTRSVLRLLRETADAGTAVLLVTHEREAAAYADAAYTMTAGKLEQVKQ